MFSNLISKLKNRLDDANFSFAMYSWQTRFDYLMDLCGDTGGEDSPYFDALQEHMKKVPKRYINGHK